MEKCGSISRGTSLGKNCLEGENYCKKRFQNPQLLLSLLALTSVSVAHIENKVLL